MILNAVSVVQDTVNIWVLIWGLIWMSINPITSLPFYSIQRKSLDLNVQPATAPSRGKTLPTPVQVEFTHSKNDKKSLFKPGVNMHLVWSYSCRVMEIKK